MSRGLEEEFEMAVVGVVPPPSSCKPSRRPWGSENVWRVKPILTKSFDKPYLKKRFLVYNALNQLFQRIAHIFVFDIFDKSNEGISFSRYRTGHRYFTDMICQ